MIAPTFPPLRRGAHRQGGLRLPWCDADGDHGIHGLSEELLAEVCFQLTGGDQGLVDLLGPNGSIETEATKLNQLLTQEVVAAHLERKCLGKEEQEQSLSSRNLKRTARKPPVICMSNDLMEVDHAGG